MLHPILLVIIGSISHVMSLVIYPNILYDLVTASLPLVYIGSMCYYVYLSYKYDICNIAYIVLMITPLG